MDRVLKELSRSFPVIDPLVIKLNKHQYSISYELGGIICNSNLKIDNTILQEDGNAFQHPKLLSYFKVKKVTTKIKYSTVEFI